MPAPKSPKHVVVDGSNIATEGRSAPSLKQLNEAVLAFMNEFPETKVTVVVDASFGHRIDKKEVGEFDAAVDNNELVTPPAGAIGRGDAFVLAIADKVKASILSNDSYQEFHGQYPWLFEQGRLVGGKPVPHVGWIFVERTPVRGEKSKRAMRAHDTGKRGAVATPKKASKEASAPMPVPKAPPPGARVQAPKPKPTPAAASSAGDARAVNDVLPFLAFVEKHPVGSKVKCLVDSYSAHGAYVSVDGIKAYAPLRLLGSPPPRSARDALKLGQTVQLVIAGYTPSRRSVEVGVAEAVKATAPVKAAAPAKPVAKKSAKQPARKAVAKPAEKKTAAKPAAKKAISVKKVAVKKATVKKAVAGKPTVKKAVTKKSAAKRPR
ncbi:MAG: NYN domain-containing protein [Actinomycetota bacterium]